MAIDQKKLRVKSQIPKDSEGGTKGISKILQLHFEDVVTVGMFYSLPHELLRGSNLTASLTAEFGNKTALAEVAHGRHASTCSHST
jgi:hypothetical protein